MRSTSKPKNFSRKLLKFASLILLIASFSRTSKAQDTLINYAGNSASIVGGQTTFGFFGTGAPAANFYYYFNVTPQSAVTFYITDFGPGNDSITAKTIFAGNPS